MNCRSLVIVSPGITSCTSLPSTSIASSFLLLTIFDGASGDNICSSIAYKNDCDQNTRFNFFWHTSTLYNLSENL